MSTWEYIPLSVRRKYPNPDDPDLTHFKAGADWQRARYKPELDRLHQLENTILDAPDKENS